MISAHMLRNSRTQEAKQLLLLFEAAQETLITYRDCLRRLIAQHRLRGAGIMLALLNEAALGRAA
jgi:hypothetical protein